MIGQQIVSRTTLPPPTDSLEFTNPLATFLVSPGRLAWVSTDGVSVESLVEKFVRAERLGQIIGPHGSGKSTLLEHLVPRIGCVVYRQVPSTQASDSIDWKKLPRGQNSVAWFVLRRNWPVMDLLKEFLSSSPFEGTLVLDGAEQLSWWQRRQVLKWQISRRAGLLWTSHRALSLPLLYRSSVTTELAQAVYLQALQKSMERCDLIQSLTNIDWPPLLYKHHGNLRECFMELYDLIENEYRKAKQIGR